MNNSYYNTTGSTGETRDLFERKARTQEEKILGLFVDYEGRGFTPTEIMCKLVPAPPITSVRRAISNLTRNGDLIKTADHSLGPYNRPEYIWKINPERSNP